MAQTQTSQTGDNRGQVYIVRAKIWRQGPGWALVPVDSREELRKYMGRRVLVEILPGVFYYGSLHGLGPRKVPSLDLPKRFERTWEMLYATRRELVVRIIYRR